MECLQSEFLKLNLLASFAASQDESTRSMRLGQWKATGHIPCHYI